MLTTWSSHRILARSFNLQQRLVLWLMGLLLLTRFSPISALATVLVVSLQVVLGESLLGRFAGFNQISRLARVGLGFCVGSTVTTFFYVLVATFAGALIAVISQIILFAFTIILRWSQSSSTNVQATVQELGAVKWLAVVALLGLSPNLFWPLPVAIWMSILFLVWPLIKKCNGALKLILALLFGSSGAVIWFQVIGTRPNRPWFADDRFAELFSFSLGKWGISHNPMMISENISYHWFSFAWVGGLANLSNTNVDVLFALFGPTIIAFVCAILGFAIIRSFITNSAVAICSLILAVVVDTERLFEGYGFNAFQLSSFSQFFSLAFGLALLLIVINLSDSQLDSVAAIVGIILFALIGSKISSGLVASFGLGGIWLLRTIKQRSARGNIRLLVVGLIVPSTFSLILFYGDPRNGSTSVVRRPGWPVGVIADLWVLYHGSFVRYLPVLFFLLLAFGGLGFMGLFLILKSKFPTAGFRNSQIFLGFGLVASLAQMCIWGSFGEEDVLEGNINTLYAFHFWISLTRFIAIALVIQQVALLWRSQKLKRIMVLIGIFFLASTPAIRSWQIEYEPSYLIPLLTTLKPVIPLILGLLIATSVWVFVRSKWQLLGFHSCPKIFLTVSNMTLIIVGMFLFASNYVNVSERQQQEWRSFDVANAVSSDFEAATKWLKVNMRNDDVVATRATRNSPKVAVLTDHKEFAGTEKPFRIFGLHSADYKTNFQLIDQFSVSGSCESADRLRDAGVNFFLVDLSNSKTPDTPRCADEVFRNKSTVVYIIN